MDSALQVPSGREEEIEVPVVMAFRCYGDRRYRCSRGCTAGLLAPQNELASQFPEPLLSGVLRLRY